MQVEKRSAEILAYVEGEQAEFVPTVKIEPEIERLVREAAQFAGDSAERWRTIRTAFRRNYSPSMYRVDGQDIRVAWAGANLDLTTAKRDLIRMGFAGHNTNLRQRAARDGKLAGIRFWTRRIAYWEPQLLMTLSTNPSAVRLLEAVLRGPRRIHSPRRHATAT
jgi:hypothetical protein